jgi:hypothetical protein
MSLGRSSTARKPRELRRRVVVPARLRHGASWTDACILNISSRGMMIHSGRPVAQGAEVELRRGDHVILARVVWREGGRAGLRAEDLVPVDEIMSLGQSHGFQLTAASGERRRQPRAADRSRMRGRAIEFAGVAAIAATLASAGLVMVEAAFVRPLAIVAATLAP